MNKIHIAELIRNDYTTMIVQFSDGSLYTYKVHKDDVSQYKVGGYALVPGVTPKQPAKSVTVTFVNRESGSRPVDDEEEKAKDFPRVKAVIVARIDKEPDIDYDLTTNYKWVVAPLSLDRFYELVSQDINLAEKFKELEETRARRSAREAFAAEYPELLALTNGNGVA